MPPAKAGNALPAQSCGDLSPPMSAPARVARFSFDLFNVITAAGITRNTNGTKPGGNHPPRCDCGKKHTAACQGAAQTV